jgi:site-specific recombinase XerD
MSKDLSPSLGQLLQSFFCQRLLAQQHASTHTVASYRDTVRLLLAFVQEQRGRAPSQQSLADWNAPTILAFLDYLEQKRRCQVRTRNARLAGLRAFMRHMAYQAPEALAQTNQILAIPLKRYTRRLVQPLSPAELEALLQATDPATQSGRRDHLLFNLLYLTGARVSEALALRQRDLCWGPPSVLQFQGKGRKERAVPLLKPLSTELRDFLNGAPQQLDALIFHNRFDQPLSRWGVVRRLQHTAQRASQRCSTLKNRVVSPHTFRHTTAMRLLQADVDIMVIALLLGHESPTTTHHYIELDLQMKERCLRKLQSPKNKATRFKPTDALLQWLNNL